jgi:hypothetical protein
MDDGQPVTTECFHQVPGGRQVGHGPIDDDTDPRETARLQETGQLRRRSPADMNITAQDEPIHR